MNKERLGEPLDRARIKTRQAGGNRPALAYLETHDVIRAANEIFGFGGWGHEVVELRQIPSIAVAKDGKTGVCVGYVCTVRLTVEGCVPTSGIGFGDATEYQNSGPVTAHELAAKEAESDALKRALKNYGDQFGLALYDKQAASSGHVTTGQTQKAAPAAAKEKTPEPPATDALMQRLVALSVEYKALVPDFDVTVIRVKATEKIGKPGYKEWLEKQIGLMETNIKAKQPSGFVVPESVKAQAAA